MTDDQPHRLSQSVQKLRLGGIKFSEAQVRMVFAPAVGHPGLSSILTSFARHRINLHQIALSEDIPGGVELYLAESDYHHHKSLITGELEPLDLNPIVTAPVGTLTMFPHASSMDTLLKVIGIATNSDLHVSGMCSSLSAFCISTDLDRLDDVAEVLLEDFSLPEGHSPFRYEPSELDRQLTGGQGRVVETIARYWEPIIRIYGLNLKTGLTRFTISCVDEQFPRVVADFSDFGITRFEMMGVARADSGHIHLQLMVDPEHNRYDVASIQRCFADEEGVEFSARHKMELVFLHGPHFQDRYGVMHTAVSALENASIEISCATCSGTGVQIVADAGIGNRMLKVLGEVFVVP